MKFRLIILSITCAGSFAHGAIASVGTGFDIAFANLANTPIPVGEGFIAAGFFSGLADGQLSTSTINTIDSSFVRFTGSTGIFGKSGFDGFEDFSTTGLRIGSGSQFLGQTLYFVFGNNSSLLASTQLAVFKSTLTFTDDSGAATDADLTVVLGGASPSPGSFIMGTTGGNTTVSGFSVPAINMVQVVPEPSALLLSVVGVLTLLRRKR